MDAGDRRADLVVAVSFTANPAIAYDADPLLVMLAFYLMVGYLFLRQGSRGSRWCRAFLDQKRPGYSAGRLADAETPPASAAANLAVRLLQVHFAIV